MADEKKPPQGNKDKKDSKDKPKPAGWHPLEVVIILFILASVAGAIITNLGHYLNNNEITFYGISVKGVASFFFSSLIFRIFSYLLSIALLAVVFVFTYKKNLIWAEEKKRLFPHGQYIKPEPGEAVNIPADNVMKEKWRRIVSDSESEDESKWRIAIIEADVILEGLLKELELPGDTVSDKLKAVEKSDFLTLDNAWEAHKARNAIAHGGQELLLNQREARRIISLYGSVFKEFYLI